MMSRILSIILLLFCFTSATAMAENFNISGISYEPISPTGNTVKVVSFKSSASDKDTYFDNCVTIPGEVTYNGRRFTVTMIERHAFKECKSVKKISIPSTIISISFYAFNGCSDLIDIIVDHDNSKFCDVDGVLYTKNMKTLIRYPEGKSDADFSIPTGVEIISSFAFSGCRNLQSISIPNSVTSISSYAFSNCSGLMLHPKIRRYN